MTPPDAGSGGGRHGGAGDHRRAGSFVFYNTNVRNRYWTDAALEARSAEYERRYGNYASLPQPVLAATKLQVGFHTQRGTAASRGSYRLENRSGAAIDTIHVVMNTSVQRNAIVFRPSFAHDARRPAARLKDLRARQGGAGGRIGADGAHGAARAARLHNDGRNPSVLGNGSWIQHRAGQGHSQRQWWPFVGYRTNRELTNTGARRQHGLPALPRLRRFTARQREPRR